jgi:hypothetical protein
VLKGKGQVEAERVEYSSDEDTRALVQSISLLV